MTAQAKDLVCQVQEVLVGADGQESRWTQDEFVADNNAWSDMTAEHQHVVLPDLSRSNYVPDYHYCLVGAMGAAWFDAPHHLQEMEARDVWERTRNDVLAPAQQQVVMDVLDAIESVVWKYRDWYDDMDEHLFTCVREGITSPLSVIIEFNDHESTDLPTVVEVLQAVAVREGDAPCPGGVV